MNIFFIGVVVSILVYIVVGIWAGRSVTVSYTHLHSQNDGCISESRRERRGQ